MKLLKARIPLTPGYITQFTTTKPTTANHTGTIIFLHGIATTGELFRTWIHGVVKKPFDFDQIKIIYPTAPTRKFTAFGGGVTQHWFDMEDLSPQAPEQVDSINQMAEEIVKIIDREEKDMSIPLNRICIGGFSTGGAMAMHVGLRFRTQVCGIFTFGSYLAEKSVVYKHLEEKKAKVPDICMFHGDEDNVVPLKWGEATELSLNNHGVKTTMNIMSNGDHSMNSKQIETLSEWIKRKCPEKK